MHAVQSAGFASAVDPHLPADASSSSVTCSSADASHMSSTNNVDGVQINMFAAIPADTGLSPSPSQHDYAANTSPWTSPCACTADPPGGTQSPSYIALGSMYVATQGCPDTISPPFSSEELRLPSWDEEAHKSVPDKAVTEPSASIEGTSKPPCAQWSQASDEV